MSDCSYALGIPLFTSRFVKNNTMCYLCEREVTQNLGLIGDDLSSSVMAMSKDVIPTDVLIGPSNVRFSKHHVGTDDVMDLYLHASGGAVQVNAMGFQQTIQSIPISDQDQNFIQTMVNKLDSIIDLDFLFVDVPLHADTSFYYDQEIEIEGSEGTTLGLAAPDSNHGWELYINYPEVKNLSLDYRQFVIVHEWGHSLGLEHPFNGSDGDVFANTTDPNSSAFPEQTVMSYRQPTSGSFPNFFTLSDLNALIEIWGAEPQWLTPLDDNFVGADYREVVHGGDGNDILKGEGGNDFLDGGLEGDILAGGEGADVFRLSPGNDLILDYSYESGDLIDGNGYTFTISEVHSMGVANMQIETPFGTTTLYNVSADEFSSAFYYDMTMIS